MNSSLMFFTFVSTSSYYVCLSLYNKDNDQKKKMEPIIYIYIYIYRKPMHVLLIGEREIWWGLKIFLGGN